MEKLILVAYIGIGKMEHSIASEYIEKILKIIASPTKEYTTFVIPVPDSKTHKIECINPRLINDKKVIKKFQKDIVNVNKNFERLLKTYPRKRKKLIEKVEKCKF